jgi:hypothetical protein
VRRFMEPFVSAAMASSPLRARCVLPGVTSAPTRACGEYKENPPGRQGIRSEVHPERRNLTASTSSTSAASSCPRAGRRPRLASGSCRHPRVLPKLPQERNRQRHTLLDPAQKLPGVGHPERQAEASIAERPGGLARMPEAIGSLGSSAPDEPLDGFATMRPWTST